MTREEKEQIDGMSQIDLCRLWRFGRTPNSLLQGNTGKYLAHRLREMDGFNPKGSKEFTYRGDR